MIMGFFDSLANLFAFFGSVHTTGTIQNLLNQSLIAFTMIFAYFYLKQRYVVQQYYGVFMILAGIVVALIPTFQGNTTNDNDIVFNLMFLLSSFFASCSLVYKEKALMVEMDAAYLQLCTVFWTFVLGWALAPLNSLPFLGKSMVKMADLSDYLRNGFKCFAGINSILSSNAVAADEADNCEGSWYILLLFIFFNFLSIFAYVLIIQLRGANMFNMISTLAIPIIQIAFVIPYINVTTDSFNWESVLGLFFIILGLLRYQNGPHNPRDHDECIFVFDKELQSKNTSEFFDLITQQNAWSLLYGDKDKNMKLEQGVSFEIRDLLPYSSMHFEVETISKTENSMTLIGFAFSKLMRIIISIKLSEKNHSNSSHILFRLHFNGPALIKLLF
jgi:drug/metabolite transporter (DMT)-like permease